MKNIHYVGDVNLSYGGTFFDLSAFPLVYATCLYEGREDFDTGRITMEVCSGSFWVDMYDNFGNTPGAFSQQFREEVAEPCDLDPDDLTELDYVMFITSQWGIEDGDTEFFETASESNRAVLRGLNRCFWLNERKHTSKMMER